MAGISAYKILMIWRKRSNATEFFCILRELNLAEMEIIKKTRLYIGKISINFTSNASLLSWKVETIQESFKRLKNHSYDRLI